MQMTLFLTVPEAASRARSAPGGRENTMLSAHEPTAEPVARHEPKRHPMEEEIERWDGLY